MEECRPNRWYVYSEVEGLQMDAQLLGHLGTPEQLEDQQCQCPCCCKWQILDMKMCSELSSAAG